MEKVSKLDELCAVADLSVSNIGEPYLQGFLLQEKGIIKLIIGDLQGALEDLTTALNFFSKVRASDFLGALVSFEVIDVRGLRYQSTA
ncbi:unnamed protein product [Calypogeia fissa]